VTFEKHCEIDKIGLVDFSPMSISTYLVMTYLGQSVMDTWMVFKSIDIKEGINICQDSGHPDNYNKLLGISMI